jgi:hypothetical protein
MIFEIACDDDWPGMAASEFNQLPIQLKWNPDEHDAYP